MMSLQARIGLRIKNLREAKRLTQEDLAFAARSDAATLSRIEAGRRNVTAGTLSLFMIALNISPREFFDTPEFGADLTVSPDDANSVNSESFSVEDVGGIARVHFPCGKHDASFDFAGLDRLRVSDAVLFLRRGLRQAELTPQAGRNDDEEATIAKVLMSAAIAESYLSIVRGNSALNPSDVWRYIIYRAFCDPQNHSSTSARKNFGQSFARTSGWAFERILASHYNPFLGKHKVVLAKSNANHLLHMMGLRGQIPADKIDLFICHQDGEMIVPLGVIHLKSSLAERRTDDVPASQLVMGKGFLSIFITMDGKDTPSSTPVNKGEYGPTLVVVEANRTWKGSEKRKDIEIAGLFSAVFSFNSRTIESPPKTVSGCRILKLDFSSPDDKFAKFILDRRDGILANVTPNEES